MYLSAPPHNTSAANINSYAINDFKILERSHEKTRISVSILIKPDLIALCLFKDKIYLKKTSTRFGWLQIVDFSLCFIKTCVFHLGLFVIRSNSNNTHSQIKIQVGTYIQQFGSRSILGHFEGEAKI